MELNERQKGLILFITGGIVGFTISLSPLFAQTRSFSDVPRKAWYADAVNSLFDKDIVAGHRDGTYRPSQFVNRAEIAVMLDKTIAFIQSEQNGGTPPPPTPPAPPAPTPPTPTPPAPEPPPYVGNLCTDQPTPIAGRVIYPIESQYAHLPYLGQIFTANKCSPERVKGLYGMIDGRYTLGSRLTLRENPSTALVNLLNTIGYRCSSTTTPPANTCREYEVSGLLPSTDLIKLEPYHHEILVDNCINCA